MKLGHFHHHRGPWTSKWGSSLLIVLLVVQLVISFTSASDSVSNAAKSSLSIGGYGVVRQHGVSSARFEDVGISVARILGFDMPVEHGLEYGYELPTSNVFSPPDACFLVFLKKLNIEELTNSLKASELPFLQSHFSPGGTDSNAVNLMESTAKEQIDPMNFLKSHPSSDIVYLNEGKINVALNKVDGKSNAADELFVQKEGKAPNIFVLSLDIQESSLTEGLTAVDRKLSWVSSSLNKTFNGRIATAVVAMNSNSAYAGSKPSHGRALIEKDSVTLELRETDEIFLLLVWSAIILFLLMFLVFFCLQWADELDPILYASLSKEAKED